MKNPKILLIIGLCVVLFMNCNSDEDATSDFESVGLILGLDTAQCACCGNWIIEIDREQNPHQFLELPNNSEIDLNTATFPISVSLNWTESADDCRFAIITEIVMN